MRKRGAMDIAGKHVIILLVVVVYGGHVAARAESAEPRAKEETGPVERLERSLKETGKSIEESVKGAVNKLEDEKLPEKTERKLKQTFDDVVQGVERMGKDIEKKFQ